MLASARALALLSAVALSSSAIACRRHDPAEQANASTTTRPEAGAAQSSKPSASAKVPRPASSVVPSLDSLVGDYALSLHVHHAHGCSRSFESSGYEAHYALHVGADGKARLTLVVRYTTTFGPSFGRDTAKSTDQSKRQHLETWTWAGTAEPSAGGAVIRLPKVKSDCRTVAIQTDAGAATECLGESDDAMQCVMDEVTLSDGKPVAILRCEPWMALPSPPDSDYSKEGMPLARSPGLVLKELEGRVGFEKAQLVAAEQ